MIVSTRQCWASIVLCLVLAGLPWQPIRAQESQAARLADIRYTLNELYFTLQGLRLELLQDESQLQPATPSDGGLLRRLDAIEAEVRTSIDRIDRLEYRINEIAADGIGSIRSLREAIVRIEQGIDFGPVDSGPDWAGDSILTGPQPTEGLSYDPIAGATRPSGTIQPPMPSVELPPTAPAQGVSAPELQRYNAAVEMYTADDFPAAINAMDAFLDDYPQSALASRAQFYTAESHAELGAYEEARKSYLASLVADSGGELTPTVMLRLSQTLMDANLPEQACRLLRTLRQQFPDHDNASIAQVLLQRATCQG